MVAFYFTRVVEADRFSASSVVRHALTKLSSLTASHIGPYRAKGSDSEVNRCTPLYEIRLTLVIGI
jgi:hypothetical protein